MRLALLSTPRSGNWWLRRLLAGAYRLEEIGKDDPRDVRWSSLPADCILQLHWHRTQPLEAALRAAGFQVLVLARHPLDVLVSILNYVDRGRRLTERASDPFLGSGSSRGVQYPASGADPEVSLEGATPVSDEFLAYSVGLRAQALLSISASWWEAPGASRVHYERMVADPEAELERLTQALGRPPERPVSELVLSSSFDQMAAISGRSFVFQGSGGTWRAVLPKPVAERIARAHADTFGTLGYACDPDSGLTPQQAERNWRTMQGEAESWERSLDVRRRLVLRARHSRALRRIPGLFRSARWLRRKASRVGPA